jgi:hypothetical protein
MQYLLRRHVFLLIGLLTLGLFFVVAGIDAPDAGPATHALAVLMRILIVPMYLVWMLFAIAVHTGLPPVFSGIGLIAGLVPYILADWVLQRMRQRNNHTGLSRGDDGDCPFPRKRG